MRRIGWQWLAYSSHPMTPCLHSLSRLSNEPYGTKGAYLYGSEISSQILEPWWYVVKWPPLSRCETDVPDEELHEHSKAKQRRPIRLRITKSWHIIYMSALIFIDAIVNNGAICTTVKYFTSLQSVYLRRLLENILNVSSPFLWEPISREAEPDTT